jgi:hypothetical protein
MISAVKAVHEARGQRGPYKEPCADCISFDQSQKYHGCRFHRQCPKLWREVNPKKSTLLSNVLAKNYKDAAGYVVQGDSPITPLELLDLRNRCVFANSVWDYQYWVIPVNK